MNLEEEKRSLISELIKISRADGIVSAEEIHFIHTISQMIGLSKNEAAELFRTPVSFVAPQSEFDRILQFHRMVLLMNVDYEVHDLEIEQIKKLGLKLGLAPQAILDVLSEMKNHENHLIPPNELIAIFTKYHN